MRTQPSEIAAIDVAELRAEQFRERALRWACEAPSAGRLICYLNAHNLNLAFGDADYAAILRGADLVYADGMGVVWGWRCLGRTLPERVNAADFIIEFCRQAAKNDVSLYLLGARPGVGQAAARAWQDQVPGLRIAGVRDGYFGPEDEPAVADAIRRAKPSIVLAGMGVPRQEQWAQRWKSQLGTPLIWCVGALFEYFGGSRSRCPRWMRRTGMEWIWRLANEPGRLGRRYLLGNFAFLANLSRLRSAVGRGRGAQ